MSGIDFDNIYYYIRPTEKQAQSWDDPPPDIKNTWDRLGIPEAERKFFAACAHTSRGRLPQAQEDLRRRACSSSTWTPACASTRTGQAVLRQDIPPNDNKFAALNSAVWSGGSFIYAGRPIEMPLQAYFRINAENMGQFERVIIVDQARTHYVEGARR
jgi:Fe-S cluster assembly protein SufB